MFVHLLLHLLDCIYQKQREADRNLFALDEQIYQKLDIQHEDLLYFIASRFARYIEEETMSTKLPVNAMQGASIAMIILLPSPVAT